MTKDGGNDLGDEECGDGYIDRWFIDPGRPYHMETFMVCLEINIIVADDRYREFIVGFRLFFFRFNVKILEPNPVGR